MKQRPTIPKATCTCGLAGAVALLSLGCQGEGSRLLSRHFSGRPQAEAKQRWDTVRSQVKLQLAEQGLKAGRLEEAETTLEQAMALAPDSAKAYLLATRLCLEQGEMAKARQAVAMAASLSPGDAEVEYCAGMVMERYGELETAKEYYSSAANRAPQVATYVTAQAEVLIALDHPVEALELIEVRLGDFEGDATMRMLAARACRLLGLRGPAAEYCRQALQGQDRDPMLSAEVGLTLVWAERFDEAITVLQPLVEADQALPKATGEKPKGVDLSGAALARALARAYLATGQWEPARRVLKPIISRDERDTVAWCMYARAALMLDELDEAGETVALLHRHVAATPETLLLAAYVALRRGDNAAALEAAQDALRLAPDLVAAQWITDLVSQARGRPKEAERVSVHPGTGDPVAAGSMTLLRGEPSQSPGCSCTANRAKHITEIGVNSSRCSALATPGVDDDEGARTQPSANEHIAARAEGACLEP